MAAQREVLFTQPLNCVTHTEPDTNPGRVEKEMLLVPCPEINEVFAGKVQLYDCAPETGLTERFTTVSQMTTQLTLNVTWS